MGEDGFAQTALVVESHHVKEDGMQESDMLDQLPDGKADTNNGTDHVMLVSLGCYCGPKLSFKALGRGSETLPFDWMRTKHRGLVHFLRNNFDGFYDFTTKKAVPGCGMTVFRSYNHSFWHDDPMDPGMYERYERRLIRFNNIDARSSPVLFVRTIPTTDELIDVPELLDTLQKKHGEMACLLLIIDFQVTANGAATVVGFPNLLVYYLSGDHHSSTNGGNPSAPYTEPVRCGLDWIVGKPIAAMPFDSLDKIIEVADKTDWGLSGLGGLSAFEDSPLGPAELPVTSTVGGNSWPCPRQRPVMLPFGDCDSLEAGFGISPTNDSDVVVVPLGCCGIAKMSILRMGFTSESLPFDWLRINHDGLLHFLGSSFHAPLREELGAGGQRPLEREGFFDFATRKPVPGTSLVMCRSHVHSFWHDDMAKIEMRGKYNKQIERFNKLAGKDKPILFVRAVATSAELVRAHELFGVLTAKFGSVACLLLIVDFQKSCTGPYVVEGYDDMLVYFLDASAHEGDSAAAPYRKPIQCAVDWVRGEPLSAVHVKDLDVLAESVDKTDWGLFGINGLNAFEPAPPKSVSSGKKPACSRASAEDAALESSKLLKTAKDAVSCVSLGCNGGAIGALLKLNIPVAAKPFEGVRVVLPGVINLVQTDFKDFFNTIELRKAGASVRPRPSQYHSCVGDIGRDVHEKNIENFLGEFSRKPGLKLFLYAVASTEEVSQVGKLLEVLIARFGNQVCLAVIVGRQLQTRLISVEGNLNVLLHFIQGDAISEDSFCGPINHSLDWIIGRPVQASVVPNFESAQKFASPHSDGLLGADASRTFEESSNVGPEDSVDGSSSVCSSSSPGSNPPGNGTLSFDPPARAKRDSCHEKDACPSAPDSSTWRQALGKLFTTS